MESEWRGLTINQNKKKVLIFLKKKEVPRCKVKLNDVQLEQVENIDYLGSLITAVIFETSRTTFLLCSR